MGAYKLSRDVNEFFADIVEAYLKAYLFLTANSFQEEPKFMFMFVSRENINDMESSTARFITPEPMTLSQAFLAALADQKKQREAGNFDDESYLHHREVGIVLPEIKKVIILPPIYWSQRLHDLLHEKEIKHDCHDWLRDEMFEKIKEMSIKADHDSKDWLWCHMHLIDLK